MIRFDAKALHAAMDARRRELGMTWKQVADEISVASQTITRTQQGGRMEVDGMLAMVNWLGVPVEAFVRNVTK
jgi:transcriptional regulator with XRE-family HTH domain